MSARTEGRIVVDGGNYLGETPVWSTTEQALYWINCENPPQLHRWTPATGRFDCWDMPERIGGVALRRKGNPVVCLASGGYDFDPATGALSLRARSPFAPHVSLHESCVDRRGRLWIGGFDHSFGPDNPWPGGSAICRLEGNELIVMIPGLSIPNSLTFSPDGKILYFADTLRRIIWRADIDPDDGAIRGMREFVRLEESVAGDGAAMDEEGGYWIALFGGGEVRRYRPDGVLDRVIKVPLSQPTKVTFGGRDLTTLYVTSTQMEVPGYEQSGPNGALLEIDVGVRGLPEPFFAG